MIILLLLIYRPRNRQVSLHDLGSLIRVLELKLEMSRFYINVDDPSNSKWQQQWLLRGRDGSTLNKVTAVQSLNPSIQIWQLRNSSTSSSGESDVSHLRPSWAPASIRIHPCKHNKTNLWGWRDASMVESTCSSCRVHKFRSPYLQWVAHNHLYLHLQGV